MDKCEELMFNKMILAAENIHLAKMIREILQKKNPNEEEAAFRFDYYMDGMKFMEDLEHLNAMIDKFNENAKKIKSIEDDIKKIEDIFYGEMDLKEKIIILRDELGYNMRKISEKLNYSYGYIRNLMIGKNKN